MRFTAASPTVQTAVADFANAWLLVGGDRTQTLQQLYIEDNPHPTGEKEKYDAADDGSVYSGIHRQYHPWFRQFLQERGYYDVFLFDLDGNLIYSVFKELDYATNLNSGEWRDTDLGNAFRSAIANTSPSALSFFDFKPYKPSFDAPASFISTAILGPDGATLGVLVFQMPIDRINAVMSVSAGLGETGETYIVGSDRLMRNDARLSEESTILAQQVETPAVDAALNGDSGVVVSSGYRGQAMLSAYAPFEFQGARWAMIAEMTLAEIEAPVIAMRNSMILIAAALLFVVGAAGVFLSRGITRPLTATTQIMATLANGDHNVDVPAQSRTDEIGEMARAVQVFKENGIEMERLQVEREAQAEENERVIKSEMRALADAPGRRNAKHGPRDCRKHQSVQRRRPGNVDVRGPGQRPQFGRRHGVRPSHQQCPDGRLCGRGNVGVHH